MRVEHSDKSIDINNRSILLGVAQKFLIPRLPLKKVRRTANSELSELLQHAYQSSLQEYFVASGLRQEIVHLVRSSKSHRGLDEKLLDFLAVKARGKHGWIDEFPIFKKRFKGYGLNCVLASAMLHAAFETVGFKNIRTTLLRGHSVVIRELENESIKLYDPSSNRTTHGKTRGFFMVIKKSEITLWKTIKEGAGRQGFVFVVRMSNKQLPQNLFPTSSPKSIRTQAFYAYDPRILTDISVSLANLSEIKEMKKPPFDRNGYLGAVKDYLLKTNKNRISETSLLKIAQTKRKEIEGLVAAACRLFEQKNSSPNPYTFIRHPSLIQKNHFLKAPDPKRFFDRVWWNDAQTLLRMYPILKQFDFNRIKRSFGFFDVHLVLDRFSSGHKHRNNIFIQRQILLGIWDPNIYSKNKKV